MNDGVCIPKPCYVIALSVENGYIVTIPESPNVSSCCVNTCNTLPTVMIAEKQVEQNR